VSGADADGSVSSSAERRHRVGERRKDDGGRRRHPALFANHTPPPVVPIKRRLPVASGGVERNRGHAAGDEVEVRGFDSRGAEGCPGGVGWRTGCALGPQCCRARQNAIAPPPPPAARCDGLASIRAAPRKRSASTDAWGTPQGCWVCCCVDLFARLEPESGQRLPGRARREHQPCGPRHADPRAAASRRRSAPVDVNGRESLPCRPAAGPVQFGSKFGSGDFGTSIGFVTRIRSRIPASPLMKIFQWG